MLQLKAMIQLYSLLNVHLATSILSTLTMVNSTPPTTYQVIEGKKEIIEGFDQNYPATPWGLLSVEHSGENGRELMNMQIDNVKKSFASFRLRPRSKGIISSFLPRMKA